VEFDSDKETLASSYDKLQMEIQNLFKENWLDIKNGKCQRKKQLGDGSIHKVKDKQPFFETLADGWNTKISDFEEYIAELQISAQSWDRSALEIEKFKKQQENN
jgi:methionyl-tRNA formyltransferase